MQMSGSGANDEVRWRSAVTRVSCGPIAAKPNRQMKRVLCNVLCSAAVTTVDSRMRCDAFDDDRKLVTTSDG